jgi:opacity protein-like surface antigen
MGEHMRIRTLSLSIAALVSISGAAFAADMPVKARPVVEPVYQYSWYVEGAVAIPLHRDYDFTTTGQPAGTYKPDIGIAGQIAVGTHFAPNWRGEVFFFYGHGKDGSVTFAGVPFPQTGNASVFSVGVNVFYTFNWAHWIKPYVGAGVGVAHYDVNRIGFPGGAFAIDDSDTTVIGLLHVGLDLPLTSQLTATARYTAAFIPDLSFGSVPPGVTRNVEAHISSIFFFGGRYSFR